jgi:phosphoglycerol transferase MdoB-like AlkP superfamily enzyme
MRMRSDHPSPSILVAAWFIALLFPTLLIKYEYVKVLSGGDPTDLATFLSGGESTNLWWLFARLLIPAEVADVAIIVGVLLLAGHLIRVPILWIACTSVFVALVLYGAEALSLHETGSLITAETLRVSLHMTTNQPDLVWEIVSWRGIVVAALAAAWTLSPLVLVRTFARLGSSRLGIARYGALVILVPSAALAVQQPAALLPGSDVSSLSRGFWQSAASALLGNEAADARVATVRSSEEINAAYERLVYPRGRADRPMPILDVPRASRRPRHIFILLLETAAQKFYPLADSEELPTFHAMSRHALVSTLHYAAAPLSNLAVYSTMSGTYPRTGASITQSGHFTADSLPVMLRPRGYESTFIDPFFLSWAGDNTDAQSVSDLGFDTILDASSLALAPQADYVSREVKSMTLAFDAVLDAERRGRKAFVVVATHIGHWPWLMPDAGRPVAAPAKLLATAKLSDALMARFLDVLAAHGLSDDIIIVVTGDHGLRFNMEFASLGEPPRYGDVMFNVPFLMYAPALFPAQVRLPFATSHVDIAPTLLDLTGTPRDGGMYHGDNMLDSRLADRITFLSSAASPGLFPVDGFHFKDEFYALSKVLNRVTVRHEGGSMEQAIGDNRVQGLTASRVREIIEESQQIFNETAEVFLRRSPPRTRD